MSSAIKKVVQPVASVAESLSPILKAGATIYGAIESYKTAKANEKAASRQERLLAYEQAERLRQIEEERKSELYQKEAEKRHRIGVLKAYYGSRGVEMAGSPTVALIDQLTEFSDSVFNINKTYENKKKWTSLLYKSNISRYGDIADIYSKKATYSLLGGGIKLFGDLASFSKEK